MRNNNLFGDDSPTNTEAPCITEISLKELSSNIDFNALKSQFQEGELSSTDDLERNENSNNTKKENANWYLREEDMDDEPETKYRCVNNRRHTECFDTNESNIPFLVKVKKRSHSASDPYHPEKRRQSLLQPYTEISSNEPVIDNAIQEELVPNGHLSHNCKYSHEHQDACSAPPTYDSLNFPNHISQSKCRKKSLPVNQRRTNHQKRGSLMITKCEKEALASLNYDEFTKDDLLLMWKASEIELRELLEKALREKSVLEKKLSGTSRLHTSENDV